MVRWMLKTAAWGVCISLVGIMVVTRLRVTSYASSVNQGASMLAYPVLAMQKSIVYPLKHFFERKKTVEELTVVLARVQHERDQALAQTIELNALLDYHQAIGELVDFKKRYMEDCGKIAHVLSKQLSEQAHYLLVDAGSSHGIKEDMVAVYNNCLLGKVIEVYPWYSKVMLITDKRCKVAAQCMKTGARGIYEGGNDETLGSLNHVSHLATLAYDDLVLSTGEGLVFPEGFCIGKIRSYQQQGLYHAIVVEPLIDVRSITHCIIIDRSQLRDSLDAIRE